MRRKMNVKKAVAMGLSIIMLGNSTGTWAEALENSSAVQETADEELNLQSEEANQMEVESTDVSEQVETVPVIQAETEYPEEASIYPQEIQTTIAESVLPDETVAENTTIETEVESSVQLIEATEVESNIEFETETESESEIETESESEPESEPETETQELESFEEPETEGHLEDTLIEGDFQYQVLDDQATIVGYLGNGGAVIVPDTIGGYAVTSIGAYAFAVSSVTSVVIPESVTKLGYNIIKGSKVESITIPKNITNCEANINNGDSPLAGAQFLKDVIFEEGMVKIPDYIAYSASTLEQVIIPSTVTEIGEWTFAKTSKLQQIELQENLIKIGNNAFYEGGLKSVTIPGTVSNIGNAAFMGSKIAKVEFVEGDKFTRKIIDSAAFKNCIYLTEIILCENTVSLGRQVFEGCEKLRKLQIPESVTSLGYHMIAGTKISSIMIPKNVTDTTCEEALTGATFLKEIIFEEGIEKIPSKIAYNVASLEQVNIPESAVEIKSYAFYGTTNLAKIDLPSSLEKIQDFAFQSSGLESIVIPKNTSLVGRSAFSENKQLQLVEFEQSDDYIQTSIKDYAFYNCGRLKKIVMSENVAEIGLDFISGTIIESITIPKGIKNSKYEWVNYSSNMKDSALKGAKYLTEIIFEYGMKTIPAGIAANVEYLKHVSIPETVTTIGFGAFWNTPRLQNIELPDELLTIGSYAFYSSGLTSVIIPSTVTNVYGYAFSGSKITKVVFEEGNEKTKTEIGYWVFGSCSNLKDLILSDNVVTIEGGLIYGTQVETLTIPKSIKTCAGGFGPLSQGYALKELIFEEGLEEIPAALAYGASSLERVIIPQTVTRIASDAFHTDNKFVIYGIPGSYAETYAKEHNIPFNANAGEYYPGLYTNSDYAVRIIDSSSKKPIKGVKITIGGEEVGVSDENGFVKINCFATETQQIKLSKIGYKTVHYTGMPWSSTSENLVEMKSAVDYESAIQDMFTETKLGQSTLYGPEISMFGQDFNIFEAKVSFDLPLLKDLVVKFDEQSQTVKVLIGFDDEYKAELKDSPTNGSYWTESYQQVKSLVKACGGKVDTTKLWNQFSKLRGKLKKTKGTAAFGVSGEITGFIEMKYNEGEWSLIDGGIVANLTASAKTRMPVCYIFYSELGIVGSVDGKLNFTLNNQKTYDMSGSVGLTLTPSVALGANAVIIDAQLGFSGTLNGTFAFPAQTMQEAFKATLTGKFFAKATSPIKFFNATVSYDFGGVELYPNFGAYLDVAEWNMAIEDRVVPTNGQSYEYADTQTVTLSDGRSVMVYITDDGTKSTGNHTTLMYSVYSNGAWSAALPVCETGRADMSPILRMDGNNAYVVWMNIGKVISADATEDDVYQNTDLWFSEFSGDAFSTPERVPDAGNTKMEFSYDLCVADGTAAVVWVENSANDPFMQSGSNTICSRIRQNSSWQNIMKLTSTFDMIGALQASISGSSVSVQYSDGAKLYAVSGNIMKELGTGNSIKLFSGITYFLRDSQLYSRTNDSTETALGVFCTESYQVYDGNVYWTEQNGYRSELYMQKLGEDNVTQLTYDNGYISDFSICRISDGTINITYTWYEINGEAADTPYGAVYVKTVKGTTVYDLVCEEISYDADQIVADNKVSFYVKVCNKSSDTVHNVRMRVRGKNQVVVYNATVLDSIAAGEEKDVTFDYVLPTNLSGLKLSVEIYSNEIEEVEYSNNICSCTFAETDLKISEADIESIVIVNQGYTTAEAVKVEVRLENAFGSVIACIDAGNLTPRETKNVEYVIPEEYLKFITASNERIFYISVTSNTPESLMADNYAIVSVEPKHAEGITMVEKTVSIPCGEQRRLNAKVIGDAVDRSIRWCSSDTSIVTVDDNGLATAVSEGNADITAIAVDGGYTVTCHITVTEVLKLTSLQLSQSELKLKSGDIVALSYTCEPAIDEEEAKFAVWTSSNEKVAIVENGTVTAVGEGSAEITVAIGRLMASCQVDVETPIKVEFKITEIVANAYNKLEIKWTASEEADGYIVYCLNTTDGTYSAVKYITNADILNYINTVVCGETYTYKVASYHLDGDNKVILEESEPVSAKALPATPVLERVNMVAYNKIRISWGKVSGCGGYVIYRSETESGKYSVLKNVTQASATNYVNVVKDSTRYYYKVRAFVTVNGVKVYSPYSDIISANVISGSPQNFNMKQMDNGKIIFSWDKVSDADGYVIYLYDPDTNKYKAIKNVTDIDVLTYGKKMTKGATYHFAMRAYRLVNGVKVYSDYGEIVSTK